MARSEHPVAVCLAIHRVWSYETVPVCMCVHACVCVRAHVHFLSQTHTLQKHPCDGLQTFASDATAAVRYQHFLCRSLHIVFPGGFVVVLRVPIFMVCCANAFYFSKTQVLSPLNVEEA